MLFKASRIRLQYNEENECEIILTTKENRLPIQRDALELKQVIESGKELQCEVKQYRKKRSIDSNSFCWLIISKIADVLKTSKEEIYLLMLERYGQSEKQLVSIVEAAADIIKRATNGHCKEVGTSELNGKSFVHFRILIGSSCYDSKQMSTLVDGIVTEAEALDISTLTPNQILEMNSRWGNK